jgi:hypothetical protein
MPTYADLELSLRRRDEGVYDVDLRFNQPDSDADIRLVRQTPSIRLGVKALQRHHLKGAL